MDSAPHPVQRRSIRLRGYDYAQAGAYFITVCTHNRAHLFGTITDGTMLANAAGNVAAECWLQIPFHFPNVELDVWVVMPNHIHGIVVITKPPTSDAAIKAASIAAANVAAFATTTVPADPQLPHRPRPIGTAGTIGSIVRGFKIGVTKWQRQQSNAPPTWQRNYWEHIVRDDSQMQRIQQYIINNPVQWDTDILREPRISGAAAISKAASGLDPTDWM